MADHVSAVCRACYFQLRQLRVILQSLTSEAATSFVHAFISCRLDYCNAVIWHRRLSTSATAVCAEHCCEAGYWLAENGAHHADFEVSALVTDWATLVHKCINGRAPEYLAEFCHPGVDRRDRRPGMRSADSGSGKLHVPQTWRQVVRHRWSTHLEQPT